ncbi:MAG: SIMPL domain-containing protein [Terracidiphilus sp.]|nr:SIMPL domain-containing protein [Terracidiphilus sp.]
MNVKQSIAAFALLTGGLAAGAQQTSQVELKIEPANRTLTVSAEGQVSVDPDVAILHIGFETQPSDAKSAYAAGAKTSNEIVAALKQAGIAETAIHSEWQRLNSASGKPHKFTLVQEWTVKTQPERAAEILDVAISAGATSSGDIDWTVQDERALEDKALVQAAARVKANAELLAKSMGVHLGALVYVTNQAAAPQFSVRAFNKFAAPAAGMAEQALAIEPRKVSSSATVYAVFAIE